MLNYSDLTVVNNSDGLPTALGYSINSSFINNKTPLFISTGGGKKQTSLKNKKQKKDKNNNTEFEEYVQDNDSHADYDSLAVPAGLVCVTETICRNPNEMYKNINMKRDEYDDFTTNDDTIDLIPEGLYDKLLALAEHRQVSKKKSKKKGNKTFTNKNKNKKTKKQLK
jgi:hypothetical protein